MLNDLDKLKQAVLYANRDREPQKDQPAVKVTANEDICSIRSQSYFGYISSIQYQLVDHLPSNPEPNTIYAMPDGNGGTIEYLWDKGWHEVSFESPNEGRNDEIDSLIYSVAQSLFNDN